LYYFGFEYIKKVAYKKMEGQGWKAGRKKRQEKVEFGKVEIVGVVCETGISKNRLLDKGDTRQRHSTGTLCCRVTITRGVPINAFNCTTTQIV